MLASPWTQECELKLFFGKEYEDTSLPGPSASGIANRPLPRDAGGRLAAQYNPSGTSTSGPVKSKDNIPKATEAAITHHPIRCPPPGALIHSLGSPDPGHDSAVPGLEGTSVRVSQPGPSNAGPDVVRTDGEDGYQWLSDAVTPVNCWTDSTGRREEMASNCISKSEVQAIARQIAKEETESSQELMMTVFKTSPLSRENV